MVHGPFEFSESMVETIGILSTKENILYIDGARTRVSIFRWFSIQLYICYIIFCIYENPALLPPPPLLQRGGDHRADSGVDKKGKGVQSGQEGEGDVPGTRGEARVLKAKTGGAGDGDG